MQPLTNANKSTVSDAVSLPFLVIAADVGEAVAAAAAAGFFLLLCFASCCCVADCDEEEAAFFGTVGLIFEGKGPFREGEEEDDEGEEGTDEAGDVVEDAPAGGCAFADDSREAWETEGERDAEADREEDEEDAEDGAEDEAFLGGILATKCAAATFELRSSVPATTEQIAIRYFYLLLLGCTLSCTYVRVLQR